MSTRWLRLVTLGLFLSAPAGCAAARPEVRVNDAAATDARGILGGLLVRTLSGAGPGVSAGFAR